MKLMINVIFQNGFGDMKDDPFSNKNEPTHLSRFDDDPFKNGNNNFHTTVIPFINHYMFCKNLFTNIIIMLDSMHVSLDTVSHFCF